MRILTAVLLVGATLAPACFGQTAPTGPVVDVPGFEAITSPHEARGDIDAFVKQLAGIVARDPGSDAAALALLRIAEVRADAANATESLRPALEAAATAKIGDPRARDRVLDLLASLHAQAGEWDKAGAVLAKRGVIRDWLVIGPFGFTRRAVHDRAFAVEREQRMASFDVKQLFEGSAGQVGWRKVGLGPLEPSLAPSRYLQPEDGCAYALAQVRGPAGAEALLSISCGGSFKAWWNGALVADVDRTKGYFPDRQVTRVTLGDGWNRLLIKDTRARADLTASIIAAGASGPIAGLEVSAADTIHALEGAPGKVVGAVDLAGAPSDPSPFARAAHALKLADAGLVPLALPLLEAASKDAPRSAHLAWHYARIIEHADHIPEARRTNDARTQVSAALERDPKFVPALERRARFLEDDGRPEEAIKALRALGDYVPARRAAVDVAERLDWENESLEDLAVLSRLLPRSALPRRQLADYYLRKENRGRAIELYRSARALDASWTYVDEQIASLAIVTGDFGAAEAIAADLAKRYPGAESPLRLAARVHRARHEPEKAAELFARVAEMRGGDPDDFLLAAETLIEAGRDKEAARWLERVLATEPGRYPVRRLLARITGEPARDDAGALAKELAVDVRATLSSAPGAKEYPKAHTICLLDQTVTRVYRDGSKVDHVHQAFKLLDDAGVDRYHTIQLPGEVLELRTIATDGKIYEPIITDTTSEILMPKLEPGAVIEYRYRSVESSRPAFQFDSGQFYFKDPNFIEPFERSQFVVVVDKGFPFETIQRNLRQPAVVEERGGTILYNWDIRKSDRVDEEAWMPTKDELLPNVQLVQRRTWDDLAELYRERFVGRTKLTPELRDTAAKVTDGLTGEAERAKKLYAFVADHVRADTGGSDAAEILIERGGSRLLLLKALLDAARIPSRFAVCGQNPQLVEAKVWDPPRPELLPLTTLVIEPRDGPPAWIFEGGRFLPFGLIPTGVQGAPALLLDELGGEMRVVPVAPLDEAATLISLGVKLQGRGGQVKGTTVVRDAGAYSFKERVATASRAQLETLVEAQLNQVFRGASLKNFDFPGLESATVPFTIQLEAEVRDLVQAQGERRTLKTGLVPLELTRMLGGKPQRQHPMMLRAQRTQRDTVEIDLGEGYDVELLPPNLLLQDRFAQYSLTFTLEDRKIRIVRSFSLTPAKIEPADYAGVLRFCREVDAAERKWIELKELAHKK